MTRFDNLVQIEREIRNSLQSFNAHDYSYHGEAMWQKDSGSITIRIRREERKLLVSIQFGYSLPTRLAVVFTIVIGDVSANFDKRGYANLSVPAMLPAKVTLQLVA